MILGKIEIKTEYTSEDGYIHWVRIQRKKKSRWISLGGSDSIDRAFKHAKRYLGMRTIRT